MNFAAIDFETANYRRYSACSIGVALVREEQVVQRITRLIRPPDDWFVFTGLHGISWDMVYDQPTFAEVWQDIVPQLDGLEFLAAHNASFDRGVLHACCEEGFVPAPLIPFVCSMKVAKQVWQPRRVGLAHVCELLGIPLNHHEAGSDAEACARILIKAHRQGWRPRVRSG